MLPDERAECVDLPSGVRRPEMVHCLAELEGIQREEDIEVAMLTSGLEDTMTHFPARRTAWTRDGRTWYMLRRGREERYRKEYRWRWEQEGIDLEGARSASGAAEAALEEEKKAEERGGGGGGQRGGEVGVQPPPRPRKCNPPPHRDAAGENVRDLYLDCSLI